MENAPGSFKDLRVWQRSMDLVSVVYQTSRNFPKDELYSLANQIRRAAVSISSNIAEGHGRKSPKEFAMFLRNANGSLREVETQVLVAERLGYIDAATTMQVIDLIEEVARMLYGLIQYQSRRATVPR
jgi:four helix bundle protein